MNVVDSSGWLEYFISGKKRRLLATARAHDATLWTQDAHFKDVEGVKYIEKKA